LQNSLGIKAAFIRARSIVENLNISTKMMNNEWTEGKAWMWLLKVALICFLLDLIGINLG